MRMKPEELEELEVKMMRSLFRGRVLEKYRLNGRYHTVAIDAVHIHSFDYEHCIIYKYPYIIFDIGLLCSMDTTFKYNLSNNYIRKNFCNQLYNCINKLYSSTKHNYN